MVETIDAEAFDFRLGKAENGEYIPEGDIAFFRAGFYNWTRLNRDLMVFRHLPNTWYKIDMFLNWDDYEIELYVDNMRKTTAGFFRKDRRTKEFTYANIVYLYILTPGSKSAISNLQICESARCPGDENVKFSYGAHINSNIWLLLILFIGIIFTL